MLKLLYVGKDNTTDENMEKVRKLGYDVMRHRDVKVPLTEEEMQCDVLVMVETFFQENNIEDFKNLKFIQAQMVGTDTVDIDGFKKRGIIYCNSRGVFDIPISEFVMMRVLDIYKRMRVYEEQTANRSWRKQYDMPEVNGKKAAVLGTGGIGTEIAKRMKPFGLEVVGFNRSGKMSNHFDSVQNINSLGESINEFDIVVIAIPLDKSTYHIFDDEMFKKMKDKSVLINIGRGAIVEEKALVNALESEKLLGAAIDVFENEPLSEESVLWGFKNFYYSPHTSFASEKNVQRMFDMIYKNLENYVNGRELNNRIV
ncbi:MAG: hypothetical protein HFE62_01455 [Firmicutes bacterium]|nr:hypothetical protein [Bacillota bacterium]